MNPVLVHRLRDAQRAIREWVALWPLARVRAYAAVLVCTMVMSDAQAQTLRPDFQITNGQVNAQVLRGDTLYVGGSFSFVGPVTGAGVPVDTATAQPAAGFPAVNGTVLAAVSDGSGGWYLGGQFTAVGSSPRSNLAHVLADGSVSSWNPGANGAVRALALRSGVLHCGGDFLSLGGVLRNRIGSVNASTGAVQAWNPNANAPVRTLVEGAGGFYVGGQFTSIGGQVRNRVALLSFTTGAADATWNPNANSTVNMLHLHAASGTVYAGGQFTAIGGQLRNRAAALDAVSGAARAWNPNVASTVNAIVADASTVYVGGAFTSVGGQARNRVAALDASTGLPTAWNPNAGNTVQTLLLSGSTLYAGGDFLAVGGEARSRLAALSTTTGLATAWNPSAFGTVFTLQHDGTRLFVGGSFNGLGGVARNNLAAFDVVTGQVTSWNPDANNQVQALVVSGDTVLVGGNFTTVAGQVRNSAAALHAITGAVHAFDPNVSGQVSAIALAHPRVYLGGLFGTVGGQVRVNLAAVNSASGAVEAWTADTDDQVFAIEPTSQGVLVGGNFTLLSGSVRAFIGALDPVSGSATAWAPDANGTVRAISAACDRIYAGGFFTSIGGQARNRAAALNPTNGQASSWDPNLNGPVFALTPRPGTVYLGGVFSTVGATARNRIAAVDPVTAAVTTWNPNSNGTVRSVVVGGAEAYAGGLFSTMSGAPSGNLAAVTSDASLPCATIVLPSGPISTAVVGGAVARSFPASGGTSPYCYRISSGALPTGLTLDPSTGSVTGTPLVAGTFPFSITATDVRGCSGSVALSWSVAPTPALNGVTPVTTGLCLNPEVSVVQVPFSLVRGDTLALRSVSVTFQVDTTRLRLPTAGPASVHVSAGAWGATFPNRTLQVAELGAGRYTVTVALAGAPCGVTTGGTLFSIALAAQGPSGAAAVSLVALGAEDCAGVPVGLNMGAAGSVSVSTSAIVVSPDSLPTAIAGVAYNTTLSATGASGPLTWTIASGALPAGLALSTAGTISGTPTASGTFPLVIRATEAAGCRGSLACTLTVACPSIAITPALMPDGSVGATYSTTLGAVGGVAPFTYAVTSGSLPAGLTMSAAGVISGTPSAVGTSILTLTATDAAGCTATIEHLVDVYATVPLSTVRAVSQGQALTRTRSRVTVPFTYTRGESDSVRGVTVSFQTDPTRVALNDSMTAAIRLGNWTAGHPNTNLQIVEDGPGAWTVDVILLGEPCGITTGGTLFTVDLTSVGPDGPAPIVVTRVKARDCANRPVPVRAGAIDSLRVQNTDLALTPATLPNGEVGTAYSVTLGASNARTPITFAFAGGTLPPGLALSASGSVAGVPTANGAYTFTVSAADADSVPGQRTYVLNVTCPVLVLDPTLLTDARVGAGYTDSIAVLNGIGPFSFTVSEGALPNGLALSQTGGLSGVPTTTGFHVFTLSATGASGCTGEATYTITVFADSAVSRVVPRTQGLCLTPSNPCVTVPFVYERADTLPARLVHVEFELDSRFALCTPASPYASIREGAWAGAASTVFQVMTLGVNRYGVDLAILGEPCGPDTTVVLFTVDVAAVGGDGVGDIVVTDARVRDCDNQPIAVEAVASAPLVVTSVAPAAIADLSATLVTSGNGTSGRIGLQLSWTPPLEGVVSVYRAPFGSYPEYDDAGGVTPDSALAPGSPWTLVSAAASPGLVDEPPVRGVWHYLAFVTDSCQMRSAPSNRTPGRPNYHLGDVSDGAVRGQGDNRIRIEDVSLLGAHYGRTGAAIAAANVAYLDVGPTVDGTPNGRPLTDDVIGFDDLMLFSLGYEVVSSPATRARPATSTEGGEAMESFELVAPSRVAAGDEVVAELRLDARGGLQGFAVRLTWDEGVLEPIGSESGGLVESQGGVTYLPTHGAADAALLGVGELGFTGSGVVARHRFRARRDGDPAVRIANVDARDAANRAVPESRLGVTRATAPPTSTVLMSPAPNPSRGAANLAFGLARRGPVELTVLSVDGRRIRTLATGVHEAGDYRVSWRGDDDQGRAQGPGVYWVRLSADGRTQARRIVYLR